MKRFTLIIVLITIVFSCNKENDDLKFPECVDELITLHLDNFNPTTPRASVEKYYYNNQNVFVLNFQNFPDGQSSIINNKCQVICSLGGIDGSENDCSDWENAEFIETVWIDNR